MRALPNNAPTNVAALDAPDPSAGCASHEYGIQYGGPREVVKIAFQHGPRGVQGSTPGIFDDDLLAIVEDRLRGFQNGPFACPENEDALAAVQHARSALGHRVAARIAKGGYCPKLSSRPYGTGVLDNTPRARGDSARALQEHGSWLSQFLRRFKRKYGVSRGGSW